MSRYINGGLDVDLSLSTLAAKTAVGAVTNTVSDACRVSSIRAGYTLSDMTPVANAGPIAVYVAHSDYTAAEVEGFIEAASAWDLGDKIAKEVRSRLVRLIGVFDIPSNATESSRLNEGRPIKTRLNWLLADGDGLKFIAYNMGVAALATTNPNLNVFGNANLWVI